MFSTSEFPPAFESRCHMKHPFVLEVYSTNFLNRAGVSVLSRRTAHGALYLFSLLESTFGFGCGSTGKGLRCEEVGHPAGVFVWHGTHRRCQRTMAQRLPESVEHWRPLIAPSPVPFKEMFSLSICVDNIAGDSGGIVEKPKCFFSRRQSCNFPQNVCVHDHLSGIPSRLTSENSKSRPLRWQI